MVCLPRPEPRRSRAPPRCCRRLLPELRAEAGERAASAAARWHSGVLGGQEVRIRGQFTDERQADAPGPPSARRDLPHTVPRATTRTSPSTMPNRGRHALGSRDRPQLARHHEQAEVELGQGFGHALVHPARQIDDHHPAEPARGSQDRPHGLRGDGHLVATAPAQHPQSVERGQGLLQGPTTEAPLGVGEIRPPHALGPLSAEEDVDTSAQGVRVDPASSAGRTSPR